MFNGDIFLNGTILQEDATENYLRNFLKVRRKLRTGSQQEQSPIMLSYQFKPEESLVVQVLEELTCWCKAIG